MLYKCVATSAKRYKVFEAIRIFIPLVLAGNIAKHPEWGNVVNVQCAFQFSFCSAARLAVVIVALTCGTALSAPIGAIVFFVATTPIDIAFAAFVFRLPYRMTFLATKQTIRIARKYHASFTALLTSKRNARSCYPSLLDFSLSYEFTFVATAQRLLIALRSRFLDRKHSAAHRAINNDLPMRPVTGSATKIRLSIRRKAWVTLKFFITVSASICAFLRHNNPLTDKLVTCSGFTAINKGVHEVYHKLSVRMNPERYHYTTYVLQTVVIWH